MKRAIPEMHESIDFFFLLPFNLFSILLQTFIIYENEFWGNLLWEATKKSSLNGRAIKRREEFRAIKDFFIFYFVAI